MIGDTRGADVAARDVGRGAWVDAILASTSDGVVVVDRAGTIREFNPAAESLFGVPRVAALGASSAMLLLPAHLAGVHERALRDWRAGSACAWIDERHSFERHAGGRLCTLDLQVTPLQATPRQAAPLQVTSLQAASRHAPSPQAASRHAASPHADDGADCEFALVFRDVTERSHAEHLRASLERAERSNRAKSEFLASMSHEIRSPMTAILGYTDLLTRHGEDPALYEDLRRQIKRNVDVMLSLIDDILDFSKIESGQLQLEWSDCDVLDLVQSVVDSYRWMADEKRLLLSVRARTARPVRTRTDELRLRQIVTNLLTNALKFTREGGVTVEIGCDERGVEIAVTDTGVGIEPRHLDEIFRSFRQLGTTPDRRYGGTGLGLSISRHLATLLGGTIHVTSKPGAGSTFTLRLPTAPVSITPQSAAPGARSEAEPTTLRELERDAIERALRTCDGVNAAAQRLGISPSTLYRRIKEYGL